jgi:hypothetical protein
LDLFVEGKLVAALLGRWDDFAFETFPGGRRAPSAASAGSAPTICLFIRPAIPKAAPSLQRVSMNAIAFSAQGSIRHKIKMSGKQPNNMPLTSYEKRRLGIERSTQATWNDVSVARPDILRQEGRHIV